MLEVPFPWVKQEYAFRPDVLNEHEVIWIHRYNEERQIHFLEGRYLIYRDVKAYTNFQASTHPINIVRDLKLAILHGLTAAAFPPAAHI